MKMQIDPLVIADLPDVERIEALSFPTPWPVSAYEAELLENQLARYIAVRADGELVGFAGIWLMVDEAHVSTIAVDPRFRGRGVGTRLLLGLLDLARAGGAAVATLDVRPTNHDAIRLYDRAGFKEVGRRVRYYEDTGEDALIMTTGPLDVKQQAEYESILRNASGEQSEGAQ